MDISLMSKGFTVRRLDKNDVDLIYDLCQSNEIFYKYHPPVATKESIGEDMEDLPPGKNKEDKYYLGFFEGNSLVAVMDLILAYPTEDTSYVGFFMVDAQYQKRGIGARIIGETFECLKETGYSKVRLGVDKGNLQSFRFWSKNRFEVISKEKYILMEAIL